MLLFLVLVLFQNEIYCLDVVNCSLFTDCQSCASNGCVYCQYPTVNTNFVCHRKFNILNPCSFFCPALNVESPDNCRVPVKNTYDPEISNEMLYLSTASYSPNPETCLSGVPVLKDFGWKKFAEFSTPTCDVKNSSCSGFTAISVQRKAIVVVFRGTATFNQLAFEIIEGYRPNYRWKFGGNVATYFARALELLYPSVKSQLTELKSKFPTFNVFITGHSLGGSLASLLASYAVGDNLLDNPNVYTFGQPRTGDAKFVSFLDKAVPNIWRVVNYIDPVPHVPLCSNFLVNGPKPVCSSCGHTEGLFFYHHGTEVWYNHSSNDYKTTDNHTVCNYGWPFNEVLNCSNGHVNYGEECFDNVVVCGKYHSSYFGVEVGNCGLSNCKDKNACKLN